MAAPVGENLASKTLLDGTVIVEGARGSAKLRRLQPGALLYTCTGTLSREFYQPMVVVAKHEVELHGSLVMIVDGWELSSVDTGFREAWTEWFKAHKQKFRMTLLVRTKLMEMAASLANLFTGISVITTYSSIHSWERAVATDVPGFRKA